MKNRLQGLVEWGRRERSVVWVVYSLAALLVLLPLLTPGYILTLDMVFTPRFDLPTELTNVSLLQAILWAVHLIVPGDIIEKLILVAILLLSGVGMYRLLQSLRSKDDVLAGGWRVGAYVGGLFYMINPFVYDRLMAGQWLVLLGYALMPFFVRALLRLLNEPSLRSAIYVAVIAFATITVSIHHVGMLLVLAGCGMVAAVAKYWRKRSQLGRTIGLGILAAAITTVLSSYWLLPTLMGKTSTAQAVASFDQAQFDAFATNSNGALGAIGEVIRLQGFWAEARDLFTLPQMVIPAWGLLWLLVWSLVAIGAVTAWRRHRVAVGLGLAMLLVGVVLTATPLVAWASQLVPLLAGYREPQKFVNLIAIAYCVLGGMGAAWLVRRWSSRVGQIGLATLCLLLPFAVTPTQLWGANGQLRPVQYPREWFAMNSYMNTVLQDEPVLFLPWHQYTVFSFSNGRIIASPAAKFFEATVITSDDPEFAGIAPTIPDARKQRITQLLRAPHDAASVLAQAGVSYILLAKEDDAADYAWLDHTSGIRIVQENSKLRLYQVQAGGL